MIPLLSQKPLLSMHLNGCTPVPSKHRRDLVRKREQNVTRSDDKILPIQGDVHWTTSEALKYFVGWNLKSLGWISMQLIFILLILDWISKEIFWKRLPPEPDKKGLQITWQFQTGIFFRPVSFRLEGFYTRFLSLFDARVNLLMPWKDN